MKGEWICWDLSDKRRKWASGRTQAGGVNGEGGGSGTDEVNGEMGRSSAGGNNGESAQTIGNLI